MNIMTSSRNKRYLTSNSPSPRHLHRQMLGEHHTLTSRHGHSWFRSRPAQALGAQDPGCAPWSEQSRGCLAPEFPPGTHPVALGTSGAGHTPRVLSVHTFAACCLSEASLPRQHYSLSPVPRNPSGRCILSDRRRLLASWSQTQPSQCGSMGEH